MLKLVQPARDVSTDWRQVAATSICTDSISRVRQSCPVQLSG